MSHDLDARRPVIVTMPEGIDAGNAGAVGDTLNAAFAQGAVAVIADCTPTTFCDSIGFNTLLLTSQKAHAEKAELLFVITPNSPLRRVLELLEMQDALAMYPSIDAAVAASRRLPLAVIPGYCRSSQPARRVRKVHRSSEPAVSTPPPS
jgi:anti-anti-sigma factor